MSFFPEIKKETRKKTERFFLNNTYETSEKCMYASYAMTDRPGAKNEKMKRINYIKMYCCTRAHTDQSY